MSGKQISKAPRSKAEQRADRLKQALKANLARRKAQARGRGAAKTKDHPEADGEQEG